MSLYEKEVQGLRASDTYYVKLLAEQRGELDKFDKQRKKLTEENTQLNDKLKGTQENNNNNLLPVIMISLLCCVVLALWCFLVLFLFIQKQFLSWKAQNMLLDTNINRNGMLLRSQIYALSIAN